MSSTVISARLDSGRPSSVAALAAVHVAFAAVALAAFWFLMGAIDRAISAHRLEVGITEFVLVYVIAIALVFWPAVGLAYLSVSWWSIRRWGPRWLRRAGPWLLALVGFIATAPLGVWLAIPSWKASVPSWPTTLACCVASALLGGSIGFFAGLSAQRASETR
jgi:hypothetical protein